MRLLSCSSVPVIFPGCSDKGSQKNSSHRSVRPRHYCLGKAFLFFYFFNQLYPCFSKCISFSSLLFVISPSLSLPCLFVAIRPGRCSMALSAMISHPACLCQPFPAARQGTAHVLLPNSFAPFHSLFSCAEKRTAA